MKKAIIAVTSIILAVSLAGCGGGQATSATEATSSTAVSNSTNSISEETKSESGDDGPKVMTPEISGTVEYEIVNGINDYGESCLMLSYTNNTNYPIVGTQFYYELKKNRTDDEEALLKQLQADTDVSDEDIERYSYFNSYNDCYTDPGETAKPSDYTFILNTINNPDYVSLAGDGRISIVYLANDKLYSVYYSPSSQIFSSPDLIGNAFDWFTSEKGASIPTLDGCPTDVSSDNPNDGFVYVYNVTLDTYEAYVEKCKEAGYSTVDFDGGSDVSLSNDDGTQLRIYYESASNEMTVKFK